MARLSRASPSCSRLVPAQAAALASRLSRAIPVAQRRERSDNRRALARTVDGLLENPLSFCFYSMTEHQPKPTLSNC